MNVRLTSALTALTAVAVVSGAAGATASSLVTSRQIADGTIRQVDLREGLRDNLSSPVYRVVTREFTQTYYDQPQVTTVSAPEGMVAINGGLVDGDTWWLRSSRPNATATSWTFETLARGGGASDGDTGTLYVVFVKP